MKQNIYDDENFFNQYEELRNDQKDKNANDLIEIPNFRKIMPNVTNKSILDLGCGYGENDKFFRKQNNKIDGVEYKVIPMEDIYSIDKKFDIIISSLAFHYIKDFDKLVKDCYNLLNKDGYLVFSQEHPFTTCIKYTENVKKGHTIIDNKYFGLFSDYNRPRREN